MSYIFGQPFQWTLDKSAIVHVQTTLQHEMCVWKEKKIKLLFRRSVHYMEIFFYRRFTLSPTVSPPTVVELASGLVDPAIDKHVHMCTLTRVQLFIENIPSSASH